MNPTVGLLRGCIDYAGLFPPAGLGMTPAVRNYARYAASAEVWALGRFVLPGGRLREFEQSVAELGLSKPARGWKLSALVGPDWDADFAGIAEFNGRRSSIIDAVEAKAETRAVVERIRTGAGENLELYCELPLNRDLETLISAVKQAGARAKVRTGGVTADAFPSAPELLRFIATCVRLRLPFKATAGLHHALRSEYPLTYETGSPRAPMFGFLNLLLATALFRSGAAEDLAARALQESSPDSLRITEDGISWRGRLLDHRTLEEARTSMVSFGSCSFTEPIEELQRLQLLESRVEPV